MKFSDSPEIEIIHAPTPPDAFNQSLDEFTKVIYSYLCQLDQNQIKAPLTNNVPTHEKRDADVA